MFAFRCASSPPLVRRWRKGNEGADAMSDYTEVDALLAEITRLIAVEKTLDDEFCALREGSGSAASTAGSASQIGRLEVKLWEARCCRALRHDRDAASQFSQPESGLGHGR